MRWHLTEEQELFRDSFHGWLGQHAGSASFEQCLIDDGWIGVGIPEDHGGQGGGLLELALAAEQFGHHAAPSSTWLATCLAVPAIGALPEVPVALAVNADAPPDAALSVDASDDHLTAIVDLVLGADSARQLVVPAGNGRMYLLDAQSPGVKITGRNPLDRSRPMADVLLDGAAANQLDVDAGDFLRDAALRAAVLVAADSLGAAQRMLDMAVEYTKQRKQFGVPIGSFQAVKHAAASMLVDVESSRTIAYYAAAAVEQAHSDAPLAVATAKAQVTAAAERVAESALTLHGAIGYTWEHDLHRFYKRAKLNTRLFGSVRTWNERLATAILV